MMVHLLNGIIILSGVLVQIQLVFPKGFTVRVIIVALEVLDVVGRGECLFLFRSLSNETY